MVRLHRCGSLSSGCGINFVWTQTVRCLARQSLPSVTAFQFEKSQKNEASKLLRYRYYACAGVSLFSGCATYRTVSAVERGSPRVYSGTRLDLNAIENDSIQLKKFQAKPPKYPVLDLPASLVLDTVMLPLTASSALYETLLEH